MSRSGMSRMNSQLAGDDTGDGWMDKIKKWFTPPDTSGYKRKIEEQAGDSGSSTRRYGTQQEMIKQLEKEQADDARRRKAKR